MKVFMLLYTLTMADGHVLCTYRNAMTVNSFKPVKSMAHCVQLADAQKERIRNVLPGTEIMSMTVQCKLIRLSTKNNKVK
jgi:hypothetical protein